MVVTLGNGKIVGQYQIQGYSRYHLHLPDVRAELSPDEKLIDRQAGENGSEVSTANGEREDFKQGFDDWILCLPGVAEGVSPALDVPGFYRGSD